MFPEAATTCLMTMNTVFHLLKLRLNCEHSVYPLHSNNILGAGKKWERYTIIFDIVSNIYLVHNHFFKLKYVIISILPKLKGITSSYPI